jgi:ribosomal protein S27E
MAQPPTSSPAGISAGFARLLEHLGALSRGKRRQDENGEEGEGGAQGPIEGPPEGAAHRIIAARASEQDGPDRHVIDIFMMSVKCGNCDNYQTIVKFRKGPEKNVYTYECENEICDPNMTRTILEVPRHLDNSTRRAEELPSRRGALRRSPRVAGLARRYFVV